MDYDYNKNEIRRLLIENGDTQHTTLASYKVCISENRVDLLEFMIKHPHQYSFDNTCYDTSIFNVIVMCINDNNQTVLKLLLEVIKNDNDNVKHKWLMNSIAYSNFDIVKILIEYADINYNNAEAFIEAAKRQDLQITELLVKKGAYVHANKDQAFYYAVEHHHFKIIEMLFQHANFSEERIGKAIDMLSKTTHDDRLDILLEYSIKKIQTINVERANTLIQLWNK